MRSSANMFCQFKQLHSVVHLIANRNVFAVWNHENSPYQTQAQTITLAVLDGASAHVQHLPFQTAMSTTSIDGAQAYASIGLQMGQVHHPMGTPEMASQAAESSSSRQGCVTSLCSLGTARTETGVITHTAPRICERRAVLRCVSLHCMSAFAFSHV